MIDPERVTPEYARQKTLSGEAILVCAYDDDEKFARMHLEGAISLKEFDETTGALSGGREIIFYCA